MKRLCLGLFLLAWAVPGETVRLQTTSPAAIEGTWSARVYVSEKAVSDPDRLQLQINLDEHGRHSNNWGQSIPRSAFVNLPASLDARQDVRFELRREAGLIAFRGNFEEGRGVGYLTFSPNREFARKMEQQTNESISDREMFSYAILDVSEAFVKEMRALGFADLTLADARKLRIHGVTADYVKEIRAAGLGGADFDDVVQLRIHGVTADYARKMRALAGSETLDAGEIKQLRIHGVTPEYAEEMRKAGFPVSLSELRQARIHGVTPRFAREMAELGYKADFDQLRQFRIHGVSPSFVREMADLGYDKVGARTLVQFRIHGITPSFVKELKDAGYTNLSDEELVDWAIHGRRLLRTKRK